MTDSKGECLLILEILWMGAVCPGSVYSYLTVAMLYIVHSGCGLGLDTGVGQHGHGTDPWTSQWSFIHRGW